MEMLRLAGSAMGQGRSPSQHKPCSQRPDHHIEIANFYGRPEWGFTVSSQPATAEGAKERREGGIGGLRSHRTSEKADDRERQSRCESNP